MTKENLASYFYDKRSELLDLRFRDLLLAKAVADIHRYCEGQETKLVKLSRISPIHCIDRLPALKKLKQRVSQLRKNRQQLIKGKQLSKEKLLDIMPSVSGIKVIPDNTGGFISFEGNGRVEALKRVFDKDKDITLEVEIYNLRDRHKVLRRVNRVRRRNF